MHFNNCLIIKINWIKCCEYYYTYFETGLSETGIQLENVIFENLQNENQQYTTKQVKNETVSLSALQKGSHGMGVQLSVSESRTFSHQFSQEVEPRGGSNGSKKPPPWHGTPRMYPVVCSRALHGSHWSQGHTKASFIAPPNGFLRERWPH